MMVVTLIGYRGSGKSSLAEALAARLGWKSVDADTVIEQEAGCTIREIFATEGEPGFRRRERDVLQRLLVRDDVVVAAGGGAVVVGGAVTASGTIAASPTSICSFGWSANASSLVSWVGTTGLSAASPIPLVAVCTISSNFDLSLSSMGTPPLSRGRV